MSGRGYAERNLPSFFANSFGTLDHFKVDCKAEELTQGQHLGISMMDTGLEKDSLNIKCTKSIYIMNLLLRPHRSKTLAISSPLTKTGIFARTAGRW